MEMDKLKQWMDIAKNMHGGDFWNNIFDQDFAKQFMNEQQFTQPSANTNGPSGREEKTTRTFPVIDVLENENEVVVMIEVPGVMKENLELGLNGTILTVKGKALPIHPQLNLTYSERFYGEFQRQITLPDSVSPNQLNAKFWNGILFVSYQRTVEKGEIIPID
ncbi:Hsp20/alpha crystallin family protein [Neobacillus sp. OS1-2]|uniref:Hsp20/alpha crystallin family protein n=1 Tax=Neobacillus sp. OS1-2 TaxID=3070680 RepID=UPI0027DF23D4|nr:Hsp20/alpha crystallin family protein [Neobacillus sp. OS1-2]WML40163.1 Hsp20/alpha crystallin family protein [Neobacillus sp. OS1-2]